MKLATGCLLAGALLVTLTVAAFHWIEQQRMAARQWRPTNTATGYRFPALQDITEIEVLYWDSSEDNFDAPAESWQEILDALTPSEIAPETCEWTALGDLRIRTRQGQEVSVGLFDVPDAATGAFCAGPIEERTVYYRGGNSTQLKRALSKACAAAHERQTAQADQGERSRAHRPVDRTFRPALKRW